MKIHVKFHERLLASHEHEYDWGQKWEFNIEAVSLKRPLVEYETLNIAGPVRNGDTVWVLHVTYSEGDSFGCATGKGEVVWVFTQEHAARSAALSIENNKEASSFQFGDDDGTIIQLSSPIAVSWSDKLLEVVVTKKVVTADVLVYDYTH